MDSRVYSGWMAGGMRARLSVLDWGLSRLVLVAPFRPQQSPYPFHVYICRPASALSFGWHPYGAYNRNQDKEEIAREPPSERRRAGGGVKRSPVGRPGRASKRPGRSWSSRPGRASDPADPRRRTASAARLPLAVIVCSHGIYIRRELDPSIRPATAPSRRVAAFDTSPLSSSPRSPPPPPFPAVTTGRIRHL